MSSKSSLKRPITPSKESISNPVSFDSKAPHWSSNVHDCTVCIGPEGTLNLPIRGGSDRGEFAYFDDLVQSRISYLNGYLENGDVILEIQGQKVAGFTQRDVIAWLNHCCKSGNPVRITVARGGTSNVRRRSSFNRSHSSESSPIRLWKGKFLLESRDLGTNG
ncbi:PDZ domain-containing protein [Trichonephila clavipes]|nr:PDZ domain-containing protein [Trichonephila clavipes]